MSDHCQGAVAPVEPYFDRTPHPFGDGPPDPLVYDASPRALRQRTVNFAAKRLADMRYVSGLDRATAERHFRWRPAVAPGGLGFRDRACRAGGPRRRAPCRGDIAIEMNDADRRVTVRWNDPGFGEPVIGVGDRPRRLWRHRAGAACGAAIRSEPVTRRRSGRRPPLAARRRGRDAARRRRPNWPRRSTHSSPVRPAPTAILIATPERVLCERYSAFGAPDRATPSWSMTKAITCTADWPADPRGLARTRCMIRRRRRCGATRARSTA